MTPSLPPLREEITLHPAPRSANGSPEWTLADPTRNCFYRIDWQVFEILSRWHEGQTEQIIARIAQETPLEIDGEQIQQVASFLSQNHLLRPTHPEEIKKLAQIALAKKSDWLTWLLHHYLFFRIPLTQPDRFLTRTLPWLTPLFSSTFQWIIIAIGGLTLFLLLRQWDPFYATLINNLQVASLLSYGITLIAVKSIHELGHAYTAKRFNCRVPTMGVAFLVLFPMLYTDTTEAWKLADKKQRLAIAMGGIKAELALAIIALLAWNLLPIGSAKSMAFWIATTSLATTLAINLSPFMRFDGYFVLSDWLDLPNLHDRSFRMAKWSIREKLFTLNQPPPEPLTPILHRFFILFALATWLYRLLVFLGIALLVYHFFIKLVGILLFVVEIGWFIVLPVWREIHLWQTFRPLAKTPWRLPLILGFFLLLLIFPWSHHITAPGVLQGRLMVRIYVPEPAQLQRMHHPTQGAIKQGETLFILNSPDIEQQKKETKIRMQSSEWEIATAGLDTAWAKRTRIAQKERNRSAANLAGLTATEARLTLTAPFSGELMDLSPNLTEGSWLGTGVHIATLINREELVVEAYLDESALTRIQLGGQGRFIPEVAEYPHLDLQLTQIDASGITQLDEPLLTSLTGGPIPVRMQHEVAVPETALIRVRLQAPAIPGWSPQRLRGTLHLEATPQSLLTHWTRTALMVVIREWEM